MLKKPLLDDGENATTSKYVVSASLSAKFSEEEMANMRGMFSRFDADGNGSIDAQELAVIMEMVGKPVDDAHVKALMKDADTDGDGNVSFEEFVSLVHRTAQNKTTSEFLDAIKLASTRELPSKYARLQNTRIVFGTADAAKPNKDEEEEDMSVVFAVRASWAANILLLIIKIYCYYISSSKAVVAALADSVVDLISQVVLAGGDSTAHTPSLDFPVGRTRIECLSVMACAAIMIVASVEVVQFSFADLYNGIKGNIPEISRGFVVYIIMGIGVGIKLALYLYCMVCNKTPDGKVKSDMVSALAEDHLNDVGSNTAAIACLAIAVHTAAWWADPVGAILISAIIVYRWLDIIQDQTDKMVGKTAEDEFIDGLVTVAKNHDTRILSVDRTIAYFFGASYNVEMDIILPKTLSLEESHDIGVSLQQVLEKHEDVERATVHVDVKHRDQPEHVPDQERAKLLLEMNNAKVDKEWAKKNPTNQETHDIHNQL